MDFHQIKSIIEKHDKIFISSHINPDGDSLGSAYAIYKYLDSIGKDCIIVNHSPIPEVYNFLNEDNIFQELDGDSGQKPQTILMMPILEGLDGEKKMSKSLGNYVGLNDAPGDMYGKLMGISDELMWRYFVLLSCRSKDDIPVLSESV